MNPLTVHVKLRMLKSEPQFKERAHAYARPLIFEGKLTKNTELALDVIPKGRLWRQFQLCLDSGETLS